MNIHNTNTVFCQRSPEGLQHVINTADPGAYRAAFGMLVAALPELLPFFPRIGDFRFAPIQRRCQTAFPEAHLTPGFCRNPIDKLGLN